jgi:hypothetical protein
MYKKHTELKNREGNIDFEIDGMEAFNRRRETMEGYDFQGLLTMLRDTDWQVRNTANLAISRARFLMSFFTELFNLYALKIDELIKYYEHQSEYCLQLINQTVAKDKGVSEALASPSIRRSSRR